ncbi:hypothetical protein [Polaribacter sp. NJDZ03]|uniref:hypothetical protein n=1 Tax=Polaribacter sp. NJDZ03 TaxID=2855841 RepID=UPI001C4A529F|nr:hypothetical protein [Polaribacter sp. NJDZ03]
MVIALVVIGIIVYFALGYFLWSYTSDNYGYNIFSVGTIIRGIGVLICIVIAVQGEDTTYLYLAGLLLLWTFIVTLVKSNLLIAIFSIFYQIVASILVFGILNRINKIFNDN